MPTYVHPALLWGLGLLALPILIHLINLLRHRRVQWAAMEFLLHSQRKNSTWIRLKELLLLLLRMLAIAAVVLMVAQPLLRNQWAELFGGSKTHHVVLLDDSFSTTDRAAETTALDEGKRFVEKLASQAARRGQSQTFTLLRFSRAARPGQSAQPDMLAEIVGTDFAGKAADALSRIEPSQTAAGPATALESIDKLLGEAQGENRIVYLVSDLRAREWQEPADLAKQLAALQAAGAQLRLVHTVDTARPNLGITALHAVPGTRAAGVQMFMELTVQNHGNSEAKDVAVELKEDGQPRPALVIDKIDAGKSETRRFPINFPTAGEHQVSAIIQGDNVPADNSRFAVVDVPLNVPVLILDGSETMLDARLLGVALAPGGAVKTGLSPQIESPAWLNNHALDKFQSIFLCNVKRLDAPAVERLEEYVQAGGGLAIFLGEETDVKFINDKLYRGGEGLFPLPLSNVTDLLLDRLLPAPDLEVSNHPIFKVFAGERNSFLGMVKVDRYVAAPKDWKPAPGSPTSLIARLRNGSPLVLDKSFGDGRVVAFLTSAGPLWNNWARNPSFVVAMLELQSHLTAAHTQDESRQVGAPLEITFDPAHFQPRVNFTAPAADGETEIPLDAQTTPQGMRAALPETDSAGIYSAKLVSQSADSEEIQQFAYNVQPEEGDLKTVTGEHLAAAMPGFPFEYQQASAFQETGGRDVAGFNLGDGLLYLLILLLVGEQILAYSASYHPAVKGGSR
ncbi:MAG: BatA domain-containing protein [Pirellulales bacterium]